MNRTWPLSSEFEVLQNILIIAKQITEYFYQKSIRLHYKENQTPVTVADCATQIFLIEQIRKKFPNDQIIAEEDNSSLNQTMKEEIKNAFDRLGIYIEDDYSKIIQYRGIVSNRLWTIDPIDGTEGFRRGLAYAIGICFLIDYIPYFCAIAVPNYHDKLDALFIAEKNHGAYVQIGIGDFELIHINQINEISSAILIKSLHHDKPITNNLIENLQIKHTIAMDGMGKFCLVAMGKADIYFRPLINQEIYIWDYCPGYLLIKEAGGVFTGLDGEIPRFYDKYCILKSNGIIATNNELHIKIINYFKKIGEEKS